MSKNTIHLKPSKVAMEGGHSVFCLVQSKEPFKKGRNMKEGTQKSLESHRNRELPCRSLRSPLCGFFMAVTISVHFSLLGK